MQLTLVMTFVVQTAGAALESFKKFNALSAHYYKNNDYLCTQNH
jgi:hypothetical protein